MIYPFPDLRARCLVCDRQSCAVYRGYYTRLLFCPELEVLGQIAIRTGYCKRRQIRFALLPDFLLPQKRISRFSLEVLEENFRSQRGQIRQAVDDLMAGLSDDFWLPISTAHSYLRLHAVMPP